VAGEEEEVEEAEEEAEARRSERADGGEKEQTSVVQDFGRRINSMRRDVAALDEVTRGGDAGGAAGGGGVSLWGGEEEDSEEEVKFQRLCGAESAWPVSLIEPQYSLTRAFRGRLDSEP
jgi:hypothetical protein